MTGWEIDTCEAHRYGAEVRFVSLTDADISATLVLAFIDTPTVFEAMVDMPPEIDYDIERIGVTLRNCETEREWPGDDSLAYQLYRECDHLIAEKIEEALS